MRLTFWLKSSSELAQFKTVPTWFVFKKLYLVSVEFFPFLICMLWTLHLTNHYIRVCFFGRWFTHHFATLAAHKFDGKKTGSSKIYRTSECDPFTSWKNCCLIEAFNESFLVNVDGSNMVSLGAVLAQEGYGKEIYILFLNRNLFNW